MASDALVIGGGAFGLNLALALARSGRRCVLLDPAGGAGDPAAAASMGLVGALGPHQPAPWTPLKALQFEALISAPAHAARLAAETGAYCKLSGIVTETDGGWSVKDLRPYVDHLLEVFGPGRLMWGSDWPVCQLAARYEDWRAAAEALTAGLGEDDRARIFGGTAAEFYRIAG